MTTRIRLSIVFSQLAAILLLAVVLCVSTSATGQLPTGTNPNACDFKKSDAKLNEVYQRVLVEYRQNKIFTDKLKVAQRAWLAFRDAHLASLYPAADTRKVYGSVNSMCQCLELEQLTKERINLLQKWIDGTIEGDVCAGSIKIRRSR